MSSTNKNTKISEQIKYINKKLKNSLWCPGSDISTSTVKDILNNKFDIVYYMDAVVCLFDNFLSIIANKRKDGIYHIYIHLSKWVKKITQLDTSSSSGFIYYSDIISDIQVIIKMSRHSEDYDDMIREYFIGVKEINKLRYKIPTFVYTIGAFICPIDENISNNLHTAPFVIFEKIPGENMQQMLHNDKLTFDEYLGMFIQVLLSLEVAQRDISFCHFDFHTANLMCRTITKECKYSVPIDNNIYEVSAFKYLPVIIDFGLSSVKNGNKVIGSYTFPQYGMKHYMLQGVDMYKFLVYSCIYSKGDIRRQIMNLLYFYSKDDPYKILLMGEDSLIKATNEYVKKGSYSRVTSKTPLMFLNWILSNSEYSNITSKYMKKKERNIFVPLYFPTIIQTYNNMFNNYKQQIEQSICVKLNHSYIMSTYFIRILKEYNKKLLSTELENNISYLKQNIKNNRKKMINTDKKILNGYKNYKIPNITLIKDYSNHILNIRINSKKLKTNKIEVLKIVYKYFKNIHFFHDILPYLQFMYTIKETKTETIYKNFITSFPLSIQYETYNQNYMFIDRVYRWCHTILDSLN